jgi:hypothetical protein
LAGIVRIGAFCGGAFRHFISPSLRGITLGKMRVRTSNHKILVEIFLACGNWNKLSLILPEPAINPKLDASTKIDISREKAEQIINHSGFAVCVQFPIYLLITVS